MRQNPRKSHAPINSASNGNARACIARVTAGVERAKQRLQNRLQLGNDLGQPAF
jgi:hypothetical protein